MLLRISLMVFFAAVSARAEDVAPLPKWRSVTRNFEKITEERKIIASVVAEKITVGENIHLMRMDGGGLLKVEPEVAFKKAQQYEKLKDVSEHIVEVRVGPGECKLFVHTEAFKWHALMYMTVKPESTPIRRIRFVVDSGSFTGMYGDFGFEEFKGGKTLMTFHSEYRYTHLPMPDFLLEFGLEIVLERVASKMRDFLEAS